MEKYPEFIEQLRRDSGNLSMARLGDRASAIQKPGLFDRIPKITADIHKRNPEYSPAIALLIKIGRGIEEKRRSLSKKCRFPGKLPLD